LDLKDDFRPVYIKKEEAFAPSKIEANTSNAIQP
jgi:hypothetical protein